MPNFNYTNDIPDAPNDPSVDQPDMKINTNSINSLLAVDHYSFNLANGGWHKQSTYIDQSIPTVSAGQCAVWGKTANGTVNLFFTDVNSGDEYQLTRADTSLFAEFATNTNYQVGPPSLTGGWTYLPGGMLLQYGSFTVSSGETITFPKPYTNAPYSVIATIGSNVAQGKIAYVNSVTATDFVVTLIFNSSGATWLPDTTIPVRWMAIGV